MALRRALIRAPQSAAGDSVPRRLVLIGPVGAGKSTTSNFLVGWDGTGEPPFKPSHGKDGMTRNCQERTSSLSSESRWTVVDTPGLGHHEGMKDKETEEEFVERLRGLRHEYFNQITGLLGKGGLVLYVHASGRHDDSPKRQVEALNAVIHGSFSTGVVLLVTRIPAELMYGGESPNGNMDAAYENWLEQALEEFEVSEADERLEIVQP